MLGFLLMHSNVSIRPTHFDFLSLWGLAAICMFCAVQLAFCHFYLRSGFTGLWQLNFVQAATPFLFSFGFFGFCFSDCTNTGVCVCPKEDFPEAILTVSSGKNSRSGSWKISASKPQLVFLKILNFLFTLSRPPA